MQKILDSQTKSKGPKYLKMIRESIELNPIVSKSWVNGDQIQEEQESHFQNDVSIYSDLRQSVLKQLREKDDFRKYKE